MENGLKCDNCRKLTSIDEYRTYMGICAACNKRINDKLRDKRVKRWFYD